MIGCVVINGGRRLSWRQKETTSTKVFFFFFLNSFICRLQYKIGAKGTSFGDKGHRQWSKLNYNNKIDTQARNCNAKFTTKHTRPKFLCLLVRLLCFRPSAGQWEEPHRIKKKKVCERVCNEEVAKSKVQCWQQSEVVHRLVAHDPSRLHGSVNSCRGLRWPDNSAEPACQRTRVSEWCSGCSLVCLFLTPHFAEKRYTNARFVK